MALKFCSLFSKADGSFKQSSGNLIPSSRISRDEEADFDPAASKLAPLSVVADAIEELSDLIKAEGFDYDLDLKTFCDACSHVSVLFGCLGKAFKFAELEYCTKVNELTEASESYGTLNNVLEFDAQNDTVKTAGSLSRYLRRVRLGLDLIRALFQNFLSTNDPYLKEAASTAYAKTCAPYHTWAVRTAVAAGMYALTYHAEESAEREMKRYIEAAVAIIQYIDLLYTSRNIKLDW